MKLQLLLATLTFLVFATPAGACPRTASNPLDYQRRPNPTRCEGLKRPNVSASFSLVSFASSNLGSYGNTLTLKVPRVGSVPHVTVRSYSKPYQLDGFRLNATSSWYTVSFPTTVLRQAGIPANSLRAIATLPGSQPVHVPVILGQPARSYQFVFFSADRAAIPTFQIRRNGQPIYSDSRTNPSSGLISFTWNPANQPAGRYQLRVVAEIQPRGARLERVTRLIEFQHNPNWLRN